MMAVNEDFLLVDNNVLSKIWHSQDGETLYSLYIKAFPGRYRKHFNLMMTPNNILEFLGFVPQIDFNNWDEYVKVKFCRSFSTEEERASAFSDIVTEAKAVAVKSIPDFTAFQQRALEIKVHITEQNRADYERHFLNCITVEDHARCVHCIQWDLIISTEFPARETQFRRSFEILIYSLMYANESSIPILKIALSTTNSLLRFSRTELSEIRNKIKEAKCDLAETECTNKKLNIKESIRNMEQARDDRQRQVDHLKAKQDVLDLGRASDRLDVDIIHAAMTGKIYSSPKVSVKCITFDKSEQLLARIEFYSDLVVLMTDTIRQMKSEGNNLKNTAFDIPLELVPGQIVVLDKASLKPMQKIRVKKVPNFKTIRQ